MDNYSARAGAAVCQSLFPLATSFAGILLLSGVGATTATRWGSEDRSANLG